MLIVTCFGLRLDHNQFRNGFSGVDDVEFTKGSFTEKIFVVFFALQDITEG
jgi:hypothetical protein